MQKEPEAVPVNHYEPKWVVDATRHFRVGGESPFACEKCVYGRGGHADFCPKASKPLEISHGDANFMKGGR